MDRSRRRFYTALAIIFPLFFLLHWNGMLSQTYFWAIQAINGPHPFGSHPVAAFISAVIIFAVLALVFEAVRALVRVRRVG